MAVATKDKTLVDNNTHVYASELSRDVVMERTKPILTNKDYQTLGQQLNYDLAHSANRIIAKNHNGFGNLKEAYHLIGSKMTGFKPSDNSRAVLKDAYKISLHKPNTYLKRHQGRQTSLNLNGETTINANEINKYSTKKVNALDKKIHSMIFSHGQSDSRALKRAGANRYKWGDIQYRARHNPDFTMSARALYGESKFKEKPTAHKRNQSLKKGRNKMQTKQTDEEANFTGVVDDKISDILYDDKKGHHEDLDHDLNKLEDISINHPSTGTLDNNISDHANWLYDDKPGSSDHQKDVNYLNQVHKDFDKNPNVYFNAAKVHNEIEKGQSEGPTHEQARAGQNKSQAKDILRNFSFNKVHEAQHKGQNDHKIFIKARKNSRAKAEQSRKNIAKDMKKDRSRAPQREVGQSLE